MTLSASALHRAGALTLLVLQNLGLSWLPRWHYAVVVGYDLAEVAYREAYADTLAKIRARKK